MKFVLSLFVTLLVLISNINLSMAVEPSNIQKTELKSLIADLNNAAKNNDMGVIVRNMPDHLLDEMAIRLRVTKNTLQDNFANTIQQQFSSLAVGAYQLDSENIQYKQTEKGRFYALVPTKVETEEVISEYYTLAMYDNTKWHVIYGGQKTVQNPVFIELYPDFEFVSWPLPNTIKK